MSMATDIVGSKESEFASQTKPDNSGYGQNGFHGPSSDTPGIRTTSGFLPQTVIPARASDGTPDWQTRKLADGNVPIHPGMTDRNADPTKILAANTHRAAAPRTNSSFQR